MKKKQTNRLSYSTLGKRFRGFLCMLTFCALVLSTAITACGIAWYGAEIITDPKENYMESDAYQSDISHEVTNLLYDLEKIYQLYTSNDFRIIDIGSNKINYYSIVPMIQDYLNGSLSTDDIWSQLQSYEETSITSDIDILDYNQTVQYLQQSSGKDRYLYFDEKAFKALFKENGHQNIEQRFSDAFSEEAYFVFYYADYTTYTDSLLKNQMEETADGTEPEEYDLTCIDYAVYDASQDIFYSSWDDYFEPMDTYIYAVDEVVEILEQEEQSKKFDSLAIPLLWSSNLGNNNGFWNCLIDTHNELVQALADLQDKQGGSLLYFIKNYQFMYSNVIDRSSITALKYTYKMGDLEEDSAVIAAKGLSGYEQIKKVFQDFTVDTVFYFGIDSSKDGVDNISIKYKRYPVFAAGTRYCVAASIVLLFLLFVQAIWLITTTGRREKKDTEIILNRFDKIPTEIWWLLVILVMAVCCSPIVFLFDYLINKLLNPYSCNVKEMLILSEAAVFPFAFFFMVLTLSFVRRCRAHNMWRESLFRKFIVYIKYSRHKEGFDEISTDNEPRGNIMVCTVKKSIIFCRKIFRNLKGTYKLLLVFILYVLLCGLCFGIVAAHGLWKTVGCLAFFIYAILQIIALGFVLYIVKDVNYLIQGVKEFAKGNLDNKVRVNEKISLFKELSEGINHIGDGLKVAVETSLKDERMKTELITNVSHDLKTPLTSIINYVDLLKKEEMPSEEAKHYIEVLESKSMRLKHLTEDLVEAAKANSGNIELEKMPLAFDELMKQAIGEFEDKFEKKKLTVIARYPDETAMVMADGRRMFRIIENVLQNAYKYALEGTRIYADLSKNQSVVTFTLKNVSAAPLNISPEELMERFTRGDESRTTEGSGLGLAIARDLTKLQDGTLDIVLDGDLFKVIITFPEYSKSKIENE